MRMKRGRKEISQGLKSRHTGPLPCEEKGKCVTVRSGAGFPSIGDQPGAKANQWWPNHTATPPRKVEA